MAIDGNHAGATNLLNYRRVVWDSVMSTLEETGGIAAEKRDIEKFLANMHM